MPKKKARSWTYLHRRFPTCGWIKLFIFFKFLRGGHVASFVHGKDMCDLSRDNVPNASHSNAERNGKRTGDERLGKPFETGTVNESTAN